MATHDYVIDNSTGSNVRSDINNVLQAILTNNSSSSAPSTTAAYMWWADTSNGILKIRNSSNNDWVELLQLDGTLTLEDGSNSAPALAFRDDLNTGIFSSAADNLDIATGGSTVANFTTGTGLTVTGDITASGDVVTADRLKHNGDTNTVVRFPANDTIALETAGNESFRVDSSRRILVNTTAQRIISGGSARLHIENNSTELLSICRNSDDNGTALFAIGKTRNGSIIQNDDVLGTIAFCGDDGTDLNHSGAEIRAEVDGAPASNDMPGRLVFRTTSDGSSSSSDRMVIRASGATRIQPEGSTANPYLLIDTSGDSVRFNAQKDSGNNEIRFQVQSSGTISEAMRIKQDGTVAIGATGYGGGGSTPLLYLSGTSGRTMKIHGGSATSSLQFSTTGSGEGEDEGLQVGLSGTTAIISNREDDSFQFSAYQSNTNNPVVNFVKPNGPSNSQTVMIAFETGNQGRGVIKSSSSDGGSPSFASASDYRIKTNIRDYTDGYNNIKAIPVKLFDMTSDGTKDIKGWIAHEVQPYIPEAVMGEKDAVDSDGKAILQNLSYGTFMPDVIGALQTAIAKIEVLETKVAALEAA